MARITPDAAVAGAGPLAGCRVIELAYGIAGPLATMWLGDMGADVVKVEWGEGDWTRHTALPGEQAMFKALNRNKRAVRLDRLAMTPALWKLVLDSDAVVVDDDAVRALALDDPEPRQALAGHVRCHVTAADRGRPIDEATASSELTEQASTWPYRFVGEPDRPPIRVGADICSAWGAFAVAQALVLGLIDRARHGRGSSVRVDPLSTACAMYAWRWAWQSSDEDHWFRRADVAIDEIAASYPIYETADGHLMFDLYEGGLVPSDEKWDALLNAIGLGDVLADARFATFADRRANFAEWAAVVRRATRGMTTAALAAAVRDCGGDAVAVNDLAATVAHPQLRAMGYAVDVDDPTYPHAIGPLWDLPVHPASVRRPPPLEPVDIADIEPHQPRGEERP